MRSGLFYKDLKLLDFSFGSDLGQNKFLNYFQMFTLNNYLLFYDYTHANTFDMDLFDKQISEVIALMYSHSCGVVTDIFIENKVASVRLESFYKKITELQDYYNNLDININIAVCVLLKCIEHRNNDENGFNLKQSSFPAQVCHYQVDISNVLRSYTDYKMLFSIFLYFYFFNLCFRSFLFVQVLKLRFFAKNENRNELYKQIANKLRKFYKMGDINNILVTYTVENYDEILPGIEGKFTFENLIDDMCLDDFSYFNSNFSFLKDGSTIMCVQLSIFLRRLLIVLNFKYNESIISILRPIFNLKYCSHVFTLVSKTVRLL